MRQFTDLEIAKRFHGHLGPNLVIGIKMGNCATAALLPQSCFRLAAEVHCPAAPPVSCVLDGVQLATGCTMGKGNIRHVISDERVKAVFTNTDSGESITLTLREGAIEKTKGWVQEFGEEEASVMTWQAPDDEIFEVSSGSS